MSFIRMTSFCCPLLQLPDRFLIIQQKEFLLLHDRQKAFLNHSPSEWFSFIQKRASNAVWRAALKTHQNSKKQPFPTALRSHVAQNARIVVLIYLFYIYLFKFRWYHDFFRPIPLFPVYAPLWHGMCSSTLPPTLPCDFSCLHPALRAAGKILTKYNAAHWLG